MSIIEANPNTCISIQVNPGGFQFGGRHQRIHTLLGSCIAITLWHPFLQIGGMCHFVLPGNRSIDNMSHKRSKFDGRYSDGATACFEQEARRHGTVLSEYQAKIFGGSNMLQHPTYKEEDLVGTRNTEAAMSFLSSHAIPLLVAHVGETGSRRITFNVDTGDVWVKHTPLQKFVSQQTTPDYEE